MDNRTFAARLEYEGWLYMLTKVDPETIDDPILAEALQEAQMAFEALVEVAPTLEDYEDPETFGTHDVEDDYLFDDEEDEVMDLVDLMGFGDDDY